MDYRNAIDLNQGLPGSVVISPSSEFVAWQPIDQCPSLSTGQLASYILGLDTFIYALLTSNRIFFTRRGYFEDAGFSVDAVKRPELNYWGNCIEPLPPAEVDGVSTEDRHIAEYMGCDPRFVAMESKFPVADFIRCDPRFIQMAAASLGDNIPHSEQFSNIEFYSWLSRELHELQHLKPLKRVLELIARLSGQPELRGSFESAQGAAMGQAIWVADSLLQSAYLGIPFYSTEWESPVWLLDHFARQAQLSEVPRPRSELAIEILRQTWGVLSAEANELRGHHFYTVQTPIFLLAVLRECNDNRPDAIYRVASQMRDYDEVRAFRNWATSLDTESNPRKFIQAIEEVKGLASDLTRVTAKSGGTATITLGLSPSLDVPIPPLKKSIDIFFQRRRHLRFMRRLFDDMAEVGPLEHELTRVLGVKLETAKAAIRLIDSMSTTKQQKLF